MSQAQPGYEGVPVAKGFSVETTEKPTKFAVSSDTWGVAVDDSKIQRRRLFRLLACAGIDQTRRVVLGKDLEEVRGLEQTLVNILESNPTCKMLMLVDESLVYRSPDQEHVFLSGSKVTKEILGRLNPAQLCRTFVLIRSANDSAEDVAMNGASHHAHGYMIKGPFGKEQEQLHKTLEPLWADRFSRNHDEVMKDELACCKDDLLQSLDKVDKLLTEQQQELDKIPWTQLWSALNMLKGDLMIVDKSDALARAVSMISGMRGSEAPLDFEARWDVTRRTIVDGVDAIVEPP